MTPKHTTVGISIGFGQSRVVAQDLASVVSMFYTKARLLRGLGLFKHGSGFRQGTEAVTSNWCQKLTAIT